MAQGPRIAWLAPCRLPVQGQGQHPGWPGHGAGWQEGLSLVRVLQQQVHGLREVVHVSISLDFRMVLIAGLGGQDGGLACQ